MWLQLVYRCLPSLSDGETVFAHACKLGLEGIVSKRKDLAQNEERKCACGEAGSRGRLGQPGEKLRARVILQARLPRLGEAAFPAVD
jgi:hypothetical protein